MKRLRIPIERNPNTRGISLCISPAVKWLAGIVAALVPITGVTTVGLLWNLSVGQQQLVRSDAEIVRRIAAVETKIERVRDDPFTGSQGRELRRELIDEMDRRHR